MHVLRRRQFGNPILRSVARPIQRSELRSNKVQELLSDLRYTLNTKSYGVGLAAPQVGQSLAIALIGLKPTPTRPKVQTLNLTLINPEIVAHFGNLHAEWEGCISGPDMYGKAMRYKKVRLRWFDENGLKNERNFSGLVAQVIQHEVDHLNGILFIDRLKDTKSIMTLSEYKKLRKRQEIAKNLVG